MATERKILVLLDGNALIHRAYHALPPLTTKSGEVVHAVYGFAMTLFSVIEKFKPEYIAASFDLPGLTFRDELYKEYKATRVKAPDDLYEQIPLVKDLVRAMNIPIYEKEGYEADDCVGTIARKAAESGLSVVIVTGDTDTLQLVTDHVKVYALRKGLKDMVLYGIPEVTEKYGFPPERLIDYKGLRGDSSDNIPGVRGIGEKGATDLIQEFGSLEDIYSSLDRVKPKLREKLEADKKMALLSKKLGTIDTTVPLDFVLNDCQTHDFDHSKIESFLRTLEFHSLVGRIPGSRGSVASVQSPKALKVVKGKRVQSKEEFESFLLDFPGPFAVLVSEKDTSLFGGGIDTIALASPTAQSEIVWNDETQPVWQTFFQDNQRKKIAIDSKKLWHLLHSVEIVLSGVDGDVFLLAYLLNPGRRIEIETMVDEYLHIDWLSLEKKDQARTLLALHDTLLADLEALVSEQDVHHTPLSLYRNLELPLVSVLGGMEETGIQIQPSVFAALSQEIDSAVSVLEKKVYDLSGKSFNLNSPKQLAEVLFLDLAIPTEGIKKNKTGYSTASIDLEKLRTEYPIVQLIEEYRELFKLKTTYVDVLPGLAGRDGRIHTTFHQDVAATGRLSSTDPNLQNIPIRTEWGARIRKGFIAAPGKKLVGADYSQIELRIAAHLSQDKNMIQAFRNGEDIHRMTAALVHNLSLAEVNDSLRREAKALNFGIIYGMGAFGLAQATGMDQKKAAQFIKEYLEKFSGVAKYMEAMKALAHEKGYIETALGRRRYLPEIASTNQALVRGAERMAINMPIQGLAADIMKLAMLAAEKLVRERYADSAQLLLQIHDELIVEVDEAKAGQFATDVKNVMESVYTLSVPLTVSVEIGNNWGEI